MTTARSWRQTQKQTLTETLIFTWTGTFSLLFALTYMFSPPTTRYTPHHHFTANHQPPTTRYPRQVRSLSDSSRSRGSNARLVTSRFPHTELAGHGGGRVGESTSPPGTTSQGTSSVSTQRAGVSQSTSSGSSQRASEQLVNMLVKHGQLAGQTEVSCPAKNGVSGTKIRLCL